MDLRLALCSSEAIREINTKPKIGRNDLYGRGAASDSHHVAVAVEANVTIHIVEHRS